MIKRVRLIPVENERRNATLIVLIRGFLRYTNLGESERVCMLYSVLRVR
jgi:hypothetical protein